MKKFWMSLLLVLFSTSVCFAEFDQDYEPITPVIPAYVAASNVYSKLLISENTAEYSTLLTPKTTGSITKVVATLKLVNSKGTAVQSKTQTLYLEEGIFTISNSKKLTVRGTYHAEATLKVYKGTKLLETINNKSAEKPY